MAKIGFIGTGNMGGAIALAVGQTDCEIYLSDKSAEKLKSLKASIGEKAVISDIITIMNNCDLVFLGVKPQILPELLNEIKPYCMKRTDDVCLVSMAAGTAIQTISDRLGDSENVVPIIRIMPNTPVSVGQGMVLWCSNSAVTENYKVLFINSMMYAGVIDEIDEKMIDAASAVSGCGPAYVYMFIEALADAGVRCGLQRDKAMLYAIQTIIGSATMVEKSKKHPGELKDMVCSPGGTTIEGVHVLENGGFRGITMSAVNAAYQKTLDMGKK